MEDVFDFLVTVEYPDAITGGLRRAADALRAVVERSRADVTTTVLQTNLQRAIESQGAAARSDPAFLRHLTASRRAVSWAAARGCSSVGRALRSQRRSRRFESAHLHQIPLSQTTTYKDRVGHPR